MEIDSKDIVEVFEEYVENQFEITEKVYEVEIFDNDNSLFCELHEIMKTNEEDHNCIGCNLNEQAVFVYNTLMLINGYSSIRDKMHLFIMTLYLLVERIDTILNLISLHEEYRKEKFKTLTKIRKWANFVKHPKAFILVHHPVILVEGFKSNKEIIAEANVIIDSSFILKYYSNDEKNKDLYKKIENKEGIVVLFPNPLKLTKDFCKELNLFNNLIKNNEVYREILQRKSTFLGFWVNDNE